MRKGGYNKRQESKPECFAVRGESCRVADGVPHRLPVLLMPLIMRSQLVFVHKLPSEIHTHMQMPVALCKEWFNSRPCHLAFVNYAIVDSRFSTNWLYRTLTVPCSYFVWRGGMCRFVWHIVRWLIVFTQICKTQSILQKTSVREKNWYQLLVR